MWIAVQADRAAGQTRQFDAYRRTRLNRELKPLLLEDICEKLLSLRATFNRLGLRPVQVGSGHRTTIRELGGSVAPGSSGSDSMGFNNSASNILIKDSLTVRVRCDCERTQVSFSFTKECGITGFIRKNIDPIILIGLGNQSASHPRGFHV